MSNQNKILFYKKNRMSNCVTFIVAICANIIMFCMLVFAGTSLPVINQDDSDAIRIVNLDLPVPSDIEKVDQQGTVQFVQPGKLTVGHVDLAADFQKLGESMPVSLQTQRDTADRS